MSEFDLGRTSLITHHIDTGDARPICQKLRRHPQTYLDIIESEVAKRKASGVIEKSCSPWASNVVVIKEHDSTPRIMLDYRQLNNVTYKDSYLLPNIVDYVIFASYLKVRHILPCSICVPHFMKCH